MKGTLVTKNIKIGGRRTSLRLEPEFWTTIAEICAREKISRNDLFIRAETLRGKASRTSGVRSFVVAYLRCFCAVIGSDGPLLLSGPAAKRFTDSLRP